VYKRQIESSPEDIAKSFALLKDVLFAKSDELSRATREFLERLKAEVKPGESFYSKQIRSRLRMNANNLKRYMGELQAYGYVKVKGGNRYRGYEYQVIDYKEYDKLREGIDERLNAILLKIKKISGSVGQSGSVSKMTHLKHSVPVS
jgi:transcription initiation factor IIE alpha subunit